MSFAGIVFCNYRIFAAVKVITVRDIIAKIIGATSTVITDLFIVDGDLQMSPFIDGLLRGNTDIDSGFSVRFDNSRFTLPVGASFEDIIIDFDFRKVGLPSPVGNPLKYKKTG